MLTNFYMEIEASPKKVFLTPEMREHLSRFASILLTALISAIITFLQALLADPSLAPTGPEQIPQAGITGAILRTVVLFWGERGTMRG
jgi:hypothetical protein